MLGSMLTVAAAGCGLLPGGGGDDGGAGGGSFAGLLASIPDTADNRQQLIVNDYARLAEATGTTWPLDTDDFVSTVTDNKEVAPSAAFLVFFQDPAAWRTALGFSPSDVDAAAQVGVPPSEISVFRTRADLATIASAVTRDPDWSGDLQTDEREQVTVYSWAGDDPFAVDQNRISHVRRLGQGGVLAAGDDGLLVWGVDPAAVEAAVDARADSADSLADNADFAGLAQALDGEECYDALLSDQVGVLDPLSLAGRTASPAEIRELEDRLAAEPALPPYRAVGIGTAVDDKGQGFLVFAFATGSGDEAEAVADAFGQVIAEGTSLATGQPWSSVLTVRSSRTDGSIAVVSVDTDKLTTGSGAFYSRDTLLASR